MNIKCTDEQNALLALKNEYIRINQPIGLCSIVSTLHWSGTIGNNQSIYLYLLINQQLKYNSITIDTYDRKYAYMFALEDRQSRINWIDERLKLLQK
jgi:hypothetical protein